MSLDSSEQLAAVKQIATAAKTLILLILIIRGGFI
jgi:hypothetical protein